MTFKNHTTATWTWLKHFQRGNFDTKPAISEALSQSTDSSTVSNTEQRNMNSLYQ